MCTRHIAAFAVALDKRKRFLTCLSLVVLQHLCGAMALEGYVYTAEPCSRARAMRIRVSPTCLLPVRSGWLDRLCSPAYGSTSGRFSKASQKAMTPALAACAAQDCCAFAALMTLLLSLPPSSLTFVSYYKATSGKDLTVLE